MKHGSATKCRVRLETRGHGGVLFVDQHAVMSTLDRRWLRRMAAALRKTLAGEVAA